MRYHCKGFQKVDLYKKDKYKVMICTLISQNINILNKIIFVIQIRLVYCFDLYFFIIKAVIIVVNQKNK